jgi:hypothetical protein
MFTSKRKCGGVMLPEHHNGLTFICGCTRHTKATKCFTSRCRSTPLNDATKAHIILLMSSNNVRFHDPLFGGIGGDSRAFIIILKVIFTT